MMSREQRLPILDGIRGLAIVLVLINNAYPETAAGSVVDTVFVHFTDFWWIGVDLFFVLSGFLITGILADTRDGVKYFRNFYARRVLRILPLYYLALFFVYVIVPHFGLANADQLHRLHLQRWYMWTYLANLGYVMRGDTHFHISSYWSLAVEEQFYLLWPLVVLWIDRRKLIAFSVVLMIVGLALRAAWLARGLSSNWVYMLLPFRCDGILVGAIVALTVREPGGRALLRRWARPVWLVAAPLSLALLAASELPRSTTWGDVMQVIGYPSTALAFGAVIVFCLDAAPGSRLERIFGGSTMRFMGRYSYGIYVWHGLVLQMLINNVSWAKRQPEVLGSQIPYGLLMLVVASGLSIVVAFLSYNLFEKHFLHLKRYFQYARPVRQDGSSSAQAGIVPPTVTA